MNQLVAPNTYTLTHILVLNYFNPEIIRKCGAKHKQLQQSGKPVNFPQSILPHTHTLTSEHMCGAFGETKIKSN